MTEMPLLYRSIIIYLAAVNLVTLIVYGTDKLRAVRKKDRIRERTLILLAAAGGSAGALAGMLIFRHKIRKPRFSAGVPMIFIIHLALICYIVFRYKV